MIITLLGYFALVFGSTALVFPKLVNRQENISKVKEELTNTELLAVRLAGVVSIVIGLYALEILPFW